ncbi:hybrid sensor histidine kinase/response regulator, partial [Thioclava sp. BHET1]
MAQPQRIALERRAYNQWVADQTLEDYALRFTATSARRSAFRIGNTALGAISFLACEAIGGALTLAYGAPNVMAAILAMAVVSFVIGLPIVYHAARAGVDVDLLTRGAGFGYLGSTITSLIYASFTFVLFSIEASIMSVALQMVLGIPLWFAHILSALVVIPIAAYGIRFISRMQMATQPIWLILQFAPLVYIAFAGRGELQGWSGFSGQLGAANGSISLLLFGTAFSILLSLLPQIGEQVDYLRFLPPRSAQNRGRWWAALLISGPGWVVPGAFKLALGSFLTYLALTHGIPADQASQPAQLFNLAFGMIFQSPGVALALTGIFVVVCQIKINVTNAYAGSIAWSNFFSRLTHSHPGRVVWLVFNVALALLLMELGVFRVIESILGLYANFAVGWMGALVADLIVNKPLGFSPPQIEFKRAHLYDINPVGTGAMALSVLISTCCFFGLFGTIAQALCALIGLVVAFVTAPLIAWATGGRYYIARQSHVPAEADGRATCAVCQNPFEPADMAHCSAYNAPICSLCCTLEARCRDLCKTRSRVSDQTEELARRVLPSRLVRLGATRLGQFTGIFLAFNAVVAAMLGLIHSDYATTLPPGEAAAVTTTLWIVFFTLFILSGIAAWLLVLAHESRRAAEDEFARQAVTLMDEIEAHERTDAALQKAKEAAEAANFAKSRYIVGLSHEIRSPLNSIFGYAQLLESDSEAAERSRAAPQAAPLETVRVIRRSAEHLSDLVDGLLDISRIESGALVLNRDKLNLPELLDQMAGMFALQARAKGIEFRYDRQS